MMKRLPAVILLLALAIVPACPSHSQEGGEKFTVERFVVAGSIEDREPVGIVDAFSSATEQVYCFLDARAITEDTSVTFSWSVDGKEQAAITLPIRQGERWRTWSSKKLGGQTGLWTVELQDAAGTKIQSTSFTVE